MASGGVIIAMKFTYCLSSVVFLMYFSVVVLVIVNGQPTTDDDIDKQEIAQLREELAKALARISKLEGKLAVTFASKQNTSKVRNVNFTFISLHLTAFQ